MYMQNDTGRNIANAIGDIDVDTSELVKDATAQETNNAIDALTSAVQGLGTALGSDKANIDGSNIANPSAFRNAISALYAIYLQAFTAPSSGTDLNTLVSNAISIYQIGNIAQYVNAPSGKGSTGLLIVFRADTYVKQLWLSNTTISQRASYNNGGTWGNWL